MQSRNGTRFNALDGRSMRVLSESKAKRDRRGAFTHMPPAEPSRHQLEAVRNLIWSFWRWTAAVNCSAETLR